MKKNNNKSGAINLLREIERRSSLGEAKLSQRGQRQQVWSGIGFRMGDTDYVAPLDEVVEIIPIPKCTRVPGAVRWVRGIANLRGVILSVIDLRGFLGMSHSSSMRQRVMVVDHQGAYTGLIVDEVFGLQHFDHSQFVEGEMKVEASVAPYILGRFKKEEQEWKIFGVHELLGKPEITQVAI